MKRKIKDKKPIPSKKINKVKKNIVKKDLKQNNKNHDVEKIINRELIQNAIYIVEDDLFLISKHRHDFVQYTMKDGTDISIDGGKEYLHYTTNIDKLIKEGKIISYVLYKDSPFEEIVDKLFWGTYGKDGTDPLKYVLLKNCETDHLQNILIFFKGAFILRIDIVEIVIKYILLFKRNISLLNTEIIK